MNQQYPSVLLEKAVGEFSKLPGIGRKTAMRLVLHLLRQDTATVEAFGNSIITLKREVKYCKVCHNISDTETCQICANPQRDASTVCVVENIRDVMAVEATQQYRGLYHVLSMISILTPCFPILLFYFYCLARSLCHPVRSSDKVSYKR